ncbi:DNA polymerase III subunit alpha [Mycoplasma sp. Z386]
MEMKIKYNYKLHNITEYSFLESTITIDKLIYFAKENNFSYASICDRNNMFGVAKLIDECQKNNLKPIIGIDLDVEKYRFLIFSKNYKGYLKLSKLSSEFFAKKEIFISDLDDENLIVIDHFDYGFYATNKEVPNIVNFYKNSKEINDEKTVFIKENRLFLEKDRDVLSTLFSINNKEIKNDFFALCEQDEINEKNNKNIEKIIDDINIIFPTQLNPLPKFKNDKNLDSKEYLMDIIKEKANAKSDELKKFADSLPRIKKELEIINELGFSDYFLIIWDLIKWAKEENIFIGPGRGSVSGSLISYILDITEINPLKYDLYFERFLNPKRVTMPDIDIDIQDTRREELIHYLINKYGKKNVALITTFQTLGAKMAFRDVARVKKISVSEVNEISKLIPNDFSLKQAYEKIPKFKAKINSNPLYLEVFEIAKEIEGLPRQHGTHAAGVVISDKEIETVVPTLYTDNNFLETQFPMEYLEKFGLLKIDLLGLKNLSVIQDVIELVKAKTGLQIKIENIPTYDLNTNLLLSKAQTNGVFQLESPGMKETLKKISVTSIDDVAAIISLFRPGPIKNIDTYAKRKKGLEEIPIISNDFDQILKSTYGIIIYQEQIMQIAQTVAKMDFADADILRRAISKKDIHYMEELKEKFYSGAISNNYSLETVEKVFSQIEKFAEYGFNKAHAVAYAVLAYKMAYLKSKYTQYFYAALINNASGSHETIKKYVLEAQNLKFEIESPEINSSLNSCVIVENKLILPFIMIKGLGIIATQKIIEIRSKGQFTSFFDFCLKMKMNKITDSIIKTLIFSNTLREFGNIFELEEKYNQISLYIDIIVEKQGDDFSLNEEIYEKTKNEFLQNDIKIELDNAKIELIQNKELSYLGMTFTKEKASKFEGKIKLADIHKGTKHILALKVVSKSSFHDKNNNEMGKITLKDSSKIIEILIFWREWEKIKELKINHYYEFEILKKENDDFKISSIIKELYE